MVMAPMDVVKQTGNTIIFEEYNKEKMDLVTLLTRDDEEITLEKFKNFLMGSESELLVKSFDEFVEKFAPTVYETVVNTENGAQFVYEFEKPKYTCTEISLKDHAFYKMIIAMMSRKATTDKGNMEFPYEDLKKALTPEAEMEDCKRLRKNLLSNTKEYMKLEASGVPSVEKDRFANNIMACRDKVVSKYQGKSPLALLPLMIADKQDQINKLKIAEENSKSTDEYTPVPCEYTLDDKGNLQLIEMNVSDEDGTPESTNEENTQLVEIIKDDFRESAPATIKDNEYVSNLVANVFAPGGKAQLTVQAREQLELEKKQYQDVYMNSLESFAKAVSAVVEKFIGVKSFFDHATYEGELPRDVSVIISNCKIDVLLNDSLARKRFEKYFGDLGREKDNNRIWYGIIPGISDNSGDNAKTSQKNINPFEKRTAETAKETKNVVGQVNVETLKEMLSLLNKAKIMTFFNYKASEKTGFINLTSGKIKEYKKEFENVDSDYAVFVYPNFTILPEEKNAVKIGTEYDEYEQIERAAYVVVPGIYLDASYVAAGMVVGVQNYKFLQSKGYNVTSKYPCVRFDLEDEENSKRVTTLLNRETTTEMDKRIKDEILENRFGFAFADNKIIYEGKVLNNSYVMNARTLKKDKSGNYKNIYKSLVKNVVQQILDSMSDKKTKQSAEKFIDDYVESWKNDNKDADKKYANRILYEGEDIKVDPDTHKFIATFKKQEEIWEDMEFTDEESEVE